jgi:hypothetical protein
MLTMAGMALIAGATMGASPAAAAVSTSQGNTATSQVAVGQGQNQAGDRAGYYRTRRSCERAGRIGEWLGRWDDYDCERVRWGIRRGWWVLDVDWNWSGGHGHGDHHGGGHGHGDHHGGGHHGGGHGNGNHHGGGHHGGGH